MAEREVFSFPEGATPLVWKGRHYMATVGWLDRSPDGSYMGVGDLKWEVNAQGEKIAEWVPAHWRRIPRWRRFLARVFAQAPALGTLFPWRRRVGSG